MKRNLIFVNYSLLIGLTFLFGCSPKTTDLTDYVDPFIGSDETDFVSLWRSEAGLYPGAVAPHGMLQLSPETKAPKKYLQGYFYKQDTIRRFSMTEHFSGWPSGSVGKGIFMPFITEDYDKIPPQALKSSFSHDQEAAETGYYAVNLLDYGISCEFSSLVRSAIGRFVYPKDTKAGIAYTGFQQFEPIGKNQFLATLKAGRREVLNTNTTIYLILTFKEEVKLVEQTENRRKKWLIIPTDPQQHTLNFKIGISYTSKANAQLNLETEILDWDLATVRQQAKALWEKELSRVALEGDEADKVTFYTALYHASLLPVNVTDVNRQFPGHEKTEPLQPGETHYHYFTPWDSFRTLHPLINFINPRKAEDFMDSSLRYYQIYGILPEPKVMTSVNTSLLFADALAQGIDFDVDLAFKGLSELILEVPYFRKEMPAYDSLGYVPYPMNYATTATLEFAFNDWAMARMAEHLGKKELAARLYERSFNYRSQYEPKSRFMLSKKADQSWAPASIYAEADKWNMSWFVPHNHQDLINLMGGNDAFCSHLNQNFAEGHYVLDNECPMNFPFLFAYADRPDLTMKWTNHTLRKSFKNQPYGVPGNDDWGTMSSWFIWGAMGLFPATPASGELILTGSLFEKIIINRSESEQIVIQANGVSKENIYIQSANLNGANIKSTFIKAQDLINGTLHFDMLDQPNMEFGKTGARPYSLSTDTPKFEVLSFATTKKQVAANQLFEVTAEVINQGALGSYHLQIKDGDDLVFSEFYLIEAGKTQEITAEIRLFAEGEHQVSLAEKSLRINVVPTEKGQEIIAAEAVQVAPLVHLSKEVVWSGRVQNISAESQQFTPTLYVDELEQETLPAITLAPGEIKVLTGRLVTPKIGFHEIKLNEGPATRFKVFENATETLVAHYTFDDPNQRTKDQSGFGNHAMVHGSAEWVAGVQGSGVRFSDGYLSIPRSASMEIEDNEMTILCWYKPVEQKGKASLITQGTFNQMKLEGKWQIKFAAGSWGRGQCFHNAKPKPDNNKAPSWLNEWTHFAGVKDATSIRVFTNGQERNRLDHKGALRSTEFEWRIASNQEAEKQKAAGVFDEVMIFRGSLSEEEIWSITQAFNRDL